MQTINTIKKLRIRSSNQEMEQAVAGAKGTLNRGIGRTATAVVSCRSLVVGRWSLVRWQSNFDTVVANDERPTTSDRSKSENFYLERQIFLGVFTNRLHQFPCLHQHLIAVVVERRIFKQHSRSTFALCQTIGECSQIADGGLELVGELLIVRHFANRTLARVDVVS